VKWRSGSWTKSCGCEACSKDRRLRNAPLFDPAMAERIPEALQKKLWIASTSTKTLESASFIRTEIAGSRESSPPVAFVSPPETTEEMPLPKPVRKPELLKLR